MNSRGDRIYAAGNLSHTLEVIDSSARRVIASIPVGSKPYTCAITANQKTAYVSNWGADSVAVVDLASSKVLRNVKVQEKPNDLLLTRDGRLFVANGNRNTVSVINVRKADVIEQIDGRACTQVAARQHSQRLGIIPRWEDALRRKR